MKRSPTLEKFVQELQRDILRELFGEIVEGFFTGIDKELIFSAIIVTIIINIYLGHFTICVAFVSK